MTDLVDRRYRIEQKLAVGGFGSIYRATDTAIGRHVALKILHRELAGDPHVVARFRRETAALAKLKSPNTLTMYDVGETDDTLYFVMELLRGETLHEVFTHTGPLPWRRMARIARGVCNSLREAHAAGIVHRDLKPANIFLEHHALDADLVKVLDFGIAKILASSDLPAGDLTRHGQMIGTFEYMAPEQMIGGACTSKSDVFTLGTVIYEMITGVRPYGDAAGPAQMLMALMTTTPRPLTGVPMELSRMVMKCMAREPQDRPEVDAIERVLESVLSVDEAAFGDADEPTLIAVKAPAPARVTALRGSSDMGLATHRDMPSVMIARDALEPKAIARGSREAIERDIDLALAATVNVTPIRPSSVTAQGTPAPVLERIPRGSDVAIRFMTPAQPMPTPKSRLASGTSPVARPGSAGPRSTADGGAESIENETDAGPNAAYVARNIALAHRQVTLPHAPEAPAVALARYAVIALCLFGLGFLGALALWTL